MSVSVVARMIEVCLKMLDVYHPHGLDLVERDSDNQTPGMIDLRRPSDPPNLHPKITCVNCDRMVLR